MGLGHRGLTADVRVVLGGLADMGGTTHLVSRPAEVSLLDEESPVRDVEVSLLILETGAPLATTDPGPILDRRPRVLESA